MKHQVSSEIGVFLSVCQAGSFAGAASALALSPSAVAKAIGRLEHRLNVRLFHRTTRRLSLTQEGTVYQQTCQSVWEDIARVEASLESFAKAPSGLVRVSLPPLLGTQIIAPALYALCDRWPDLDFDLTTSPAFSDLIGDGIDLAVRIGHLPDLPGIMARRLGCQQVVLCAAASYAADHGLPGSIAQLSDHRLIGSKHRGKAVSWHFITPQGDLAAYTPQTRLVLDGSMLTLSAIRAGHGIGLVPRWLVRDDLEQGSLLSVLPDALAGHLPVHALWVASPTMLPRLRVSIDAVAAATAPVLAEQL